MTKRIGILGGAFDPVHHSHLKLAEYALKYVDEVWFQPCYTHMFGKNMTADEHRVAMLRAAVEEVLGDSAKRGKVRISTYEMDQKLSLPTIEILNRMDRSTKNNEFYPIIGQDNADSIEKWRNWQELIATRPFIVFPREGYGMHYTRSGMIPSPDYEPLDWYQEEPHLFAKDVIPMNSSTNIREILTGIQRSAFLGGPNPTIGSSTGKVPNEWWEKEVDRCRTKFMELKTPGSVLDYIREHNLYPIDPDDPVVNAFRESSIQQTKDPASS